MPQYKPNGGTELRVTVLAIGKEEQNKAQLSLYLMGHLTATVEEKFALRDPTGKPDWFLFKWNPIWLAATPYMTTGVVRVVESP